MRGDRTSLFVCLRIFNLFAAVANCWFCENLWAYCSLVHYVNNTDVTYNFTTPHESMLAQCMLCPCVCPCVCSIKLAKLVIMYASVPILWNNCGVYHDKGAKHGVIIKSCLWLFVECNYELSYCLLCVYVVLGSNGVAAFWKYNQLCVVSWWNLSLKFCY